MPGFPLIDPRKMTICVDYPDFSHCSLQHSASYVEAEISCFKSKLQTYFHLSAFIKNIAWIFFSNYKMTFTEFPSHI